MKLRDISISNASTDFISVQDVDATNGGRYYITDRRVQDFHALQNAPVGMRTVSHVYIANGIVRVYLKPKRG